MLIRNELIRPTGRTIEKNDSSAVRTFHEFEGGIVADSVRVGKTKVGTTAVYIKGGEKIHPPTPLPRIVRGPSTAAIRSYLLSFSQ